MRLDFRFGFFGGNWNFLVETLAEWNTADVKWPSVRYISSTWLLFKNFNTSLVKVNQAIISWLLTCQWVKLTLCNIFILNINTWEWFKGTKDHKVRKDYWILIKMSITTHLSDLIKKCINRKFLTKLLSTLSFNFQSGTHHFQMVTVTPLMYSLVGLVWWRQQNSLLFCPF